ncbi:MAG TPA: aspartate aminotransferase family protein [Thermomicrobiales bacterium]|nr:aspartate aminotransferase family protein [Thermomicrobiales bacterium]
MATDTTHRSTEELLGADKALQIPLYAKRDIVLVRGEGAYLYDNDGKRYLDAMSNYGVAVLGHAHPRYTQALVNQAHRLTTTHQSFGNDARSEFLETLMTIAPEGVRRSFLSNSGTEAIEAALKFARAATGREKIVAARRGYHGRTFGALSATADKKYRDPFLPLPIPAEHVPFNDPDALEAAIDDTTAAVILEPLQGEGGIHPADAEYLRRARDVTRAKGAMLIADEVQSAIRTGVPFAMTSAGVTPDIIATAKAIANGFPIGVTLVTEAISEAMPGGAHGSTFGGNPLACRVATETLRVLQDDGLYENARARGEQIKAGIEALGSSKVRAVRGSGMMIGVELKAKATPTLKALQDRGVLALMAGNLVIRLLPPMIYGQDEVDELLAAFGDVLGE